MELRHLRYFKVVAELQHFHQAAEKLHITQPALSNQMKQLEEELNIALFHRVGRHVKLSESGAKVLDVANKILNEVDLLKEAVSDIESGQTGSLRIGVLQSINALYCREIVLEFDRLHPGIALHIEELSNRQIEQRLLTGDIDVGIGFILDKKYHHDLLFESLFSEAWKLIINHESAHFAPAIMQGQPHPLKAVLLPEGFETRSVVDQFFEDHQIFTSKITEVNTISFILDLVENGMAFSILPEAFSRLTTSAKRRVFDLSPAPKERQIGLFTVKDRLRKKSVEHFCTLIRNQLKQE